MAAPTVASNSPPIPDLAEREEAGGGASGGRGEKASDGATIVKDGVARQRGLIGGSEGGGQRRIPPWQRRVDPVGEFGFKIQNL